MTKHKIQLGQVYRSNNNGLQILVAGKKDAKWLCKVLTEKPNVYNGSHRMSEYVLRKRFTLIP